MIVWKIHGDEAHPMNMGGIGFFETKSDAEQFAKGTGMRGVRPERVKVENRTQLADELNLAVGFGFTGHDSANESNYYADADAEVNEESE